MLEVLGGSAYGGFLVRFGRVARRPRRVAVYAGFEFFPIDGGVSEVADIYAGYRYSLPLKRFIRVFRPSVSCGNP